MSLRVKNWARFQHYKHRKPPWIRLYRELLDDMQWHRLPVASRALAPMLWLLASETNDGTIDGDNQTIAFRLRHSDEEFADAISPLISGGWFICEQDASGMLAGRSQDATSESEFRVQSSEVETSSPATSDNSARKARADRRGTRLTDDFQLTQELRDFASDLGLDPSGTRDEFVDFWTAVPGTRGLKLDWGKTFKNRCRELAGKRSRRSAEPAGESWRDRQVREAHEAIDRELAK